MEYREVYRRAKKCCEQCGKPANPAEGRTLEIDHVLPVSQGGTNDINNLQLLCNFCNGAKSGSRDFQAEARARNPARYDNIVEQVSKLVGKKKSILDKGSAEKGAVSKQWAHGTISSLSQSPSPEQQYS